jgi:outer membrane protein assembly factor BamB
MRIFRSTEMVKLVDYTMQKWSFTSLRFLTRHRGIKMRIFAVQCICLTACATNVLAGDWPQILGPDRNGVASNETLLESWPTDGPERLWSYPLGEGFSGPVIQGETVVVFHRVAQAERIEALNASTGRSLWRTDFPASFRGGINPDSGPRATAVIDGNRVFAIGAAGQVICVALDSGRTQWTRDAATDFRAQEGYFGFGSSPIVVGSNVLINIGGDNAGIVAFDTQTGKTSWAATDCRASYSSPVVATLAGKPAVIFIARLNAVALDPNDGTVLWSIPFGARGPTVNGAVPLVFDQQLFLSASYRVGAQLLDIHGPKPSRIWSNDHSLSSQYTSFVVHEGYIYGTHGREDIPPAHLRCIDAKTGTVKWTAENHGMTHVIRVDDRLLLLDIQGTLSLARTNPNKFERLAKATITSSGTRAVPALAHGVLYLRTTNDGDAGELMALTVGKRDE